VAVVASERLSGRGAGRTPTHTLPVEGEGRTQRLPYSAGAAAAICCWFGTRIQNSEMIAEASAQAANA